MAPRRVRRRPVTASMALPLLALLLLAAGCADEPTTSSNNSDATGLQLRVAGRVDDGLICPGDRRPCLLFESTLDLADGEIVWITGELADGVFRVDGQQPLPEPASRDDANQCPDQVIDGPPPNDVLESLYEDESSRPDGFADLWDSDDGVLHLGVAGDPAAAERYLDDLGIADQVCLVTGFAHSDLVLERVQSQVGEAASAAGFDNWGSSRDSWEGTVTLDLPRLGAELRDELDAISAANDGVTINVFASVEVINGSIEDYDRAREGSEVSPEPASQLVARCGSVVFSSVPPDLDEFPPLDAEAQAALSELTDGPTGVEAGEFAGDVQWSIASRTDDELIFFGQPNGSDEANWLNANFDKQDDVWRPTGWGGCRVQIEAPGFGPATVGTDPNQPPASDATELALLINEQECASGRAPVDREVVILVTETANAVTIIALVAPVEGGAECPSNPWHPVTVTLDQPLGERQLLDGHLYPTRPVQPADEAD